MIAFRIFRCAMHLRHATERVRILHIHLGLPDQFAAFQQFGNPCSRPNLPLVRPNRVYGVRERLNSAVVGLQRHGADLVRPIAQTLTLQERPHGKGIHVLRSVEQGKSLFGHKLDGFPAHSLQYVCSGKDFPSIFNFSHPDKWQREVCQWDKIA